MKSIFLKEYISIIAVFAAVAATLLSVLELKGVGDTYKIWFAIAASANAAGISVYLSRMRERRLQRQRIFIIYSSKDRESASRIVQYLRDKGYNPWFDVDEIAPGQKWALSIMKGIAESAVALFLVSNNLKIADDNFVSEELKAAMSNMRSRDESFSPIIPVRLDDTAVPHDLSDVHWVDIRNEDSYEQLEKGLKRILGQA